jgi:hypothetical protein
MRSWVGDHRLTITGNVYTEDGTPLFIQPTSPANIEINLVTSNIIEKVTTSGGSGEGMTLSQLQSELTSRSLSRQQITGGNWALSTDSNGRIRIVSGTGPGELLLNSGYVSTTGGGGSPTSPDGPYAFTVTVLRITDNSEVPNARVTITDGNDLWFAYTDSDGEAELMIKSGIFTLTVWVAGSVHTSQTINVVGNSSTTTFVTPVVILPPAVNDMTSAYTYVNFAPNEGPVIFEFNLVIPPPEPTNFSYSLACFTITVQNGNSVLTVPLFKSARYRARRNNGTWVFFDTTTNSTFPLPPLPG